MKILVLSNMYPSEKDPVFGTFVKNFVDAITSRNAAGHTQIVVIKGRDGNILQKLIKYFLFYTKSLFYILFVKYDIIYIHCLTYSAVSVRFATYLKKLNFIINVHGGDILTRSNFAGKLRTFNTPLIYKSNMVVSPSMFFKNILLREFPNLDENKIFVSPSGGVNIEIFKPLKKSPSTYTVGYVSRIDEGKGWKTTVDAIKILVQNGVTDLKVIMAGRGAQTSQLEDYIRKQNLSEIIEYIGPVPYNELPGLYPRFDVFLFPTLLEESLGLVAIEAMACGVPVIGSRIGGLQDYIEDSINGFYFEPGNCEDLAEKILTHKKMPDNDKIILKNNSLKTSSLYNSPKVFDELFERIKKSI